MVRYHEIAVIHLFVRCKQEAQLSLRDHAIFCVTEYFAKSLKVIRNDALK